MARSGLYKSDVQRARDTLRADGKNPSVDAVRVALGNTGSKTTIHRYLKELEAEEGQGVGAKIAVSEALQDLIARLAERLHGEAEAVIGQAQERFQVQLQERSDALDQARQEVGGLSTQLQRTETALQAEREARQAIDRELATNLIKAAQLEERIAGLTARVAEHESHARSLEQKHEHAREALAHYRTSVKDQREQEQRRHEHQLQELQVALRQANEALNTKNHELVQLNRDNGQWLERHSRLERELVGARHAVDAQQADLDALRTMAAEHKALQARWAQDLQALDAVKSELAVAYTTLARETERREHAEADALRSSVRLTTVEQVLAQLRPQPDQKAVHQPVSPGATPAK